MGDQFELITAFSREGPSKVYVQHRLKERSQEVFDLLQKKAYFYVCGDAANMAREVNTVLAQIIAEGRGITEAKGEEAVKNMRSSNQYQVCQTPATASVLALPLEAALTRIVFLLSRRMSGLRETKSHKSNNERQGKQKVTCGGRSTRVFFG